jgi:peroxiredoxin
MEINRKHLLSLVVGLLIVSTMAPDVKSGTPAFAAETVDLKASDFSLADLDGKQFKLSDCRGKPVLLIFGATWCPNCRADIPRFKDIHSRYSKRGLEMIYINIQESRDKVARFAQKYKLPYRVLVDHDGRVSDLYEILGVPVIILIDGTGKIACWQCRKLDSILDTMFKQQ